MKFYGRLRVQGFRAFGCRDFSGILGFRLRGVRRLGAVVAVVGPYLLWLVAQTRMSEGPKP